MPSRRYAAFLRGVSPMSLRMSALKDCLERAGFTDVRTLLSSGNATFNAPAASEAALERKVEAALQEHLGRTFMTMVRSIDALQALLGSNPFRGFEAAGAKRVVTFLREAPAARPPLPIEFDGARILRVAEREAFSDYVVGPRGPVFMTLLEKTFGAAITTRTWDTVRKVAGQVTAAPAAPKTPPGRGKAASAVRAKKRA